MLTLNCKKRGLLLETDCEFADTISRDCMVNKRMELFVSERELFPTQNIRVAEQNGLEQIYGTTTLFHIKRNLIKNLNLPCLCRANAKTKITTKYLSIIFSV